MVHFLNTLFEYRVKDCDQYCRNQSTVATLEDILT